MVLAELQRDDSRSPQFVPDILVRLGQLRAYPELVLPREIERRAYAEAREIGRGLRSNAPDILNRHLVEIEVQVGAANDGQACGLLPFGSELGDDFRGRQADCESDAQVVLQVRLDAGRHGLVGHAKGRRRPVGRKSIRLYCTLPRPGCSGARS